MIGNHEVAAIALCSQLDRAYRRPMPLQNYERLEEIGKLLGGLTGNGLVRDLLAHLRRVEETAREEAARAFLDGAIEKLDQRRVAA